MQPKKDWNLVDIVKEIEPRCVLFLDRVPPVRISGPEKDRFLCMLREHNEWRTSLSSAQPPSPTRSVKQPYVASTAVSSTAVSSGFSATGKTCPP